MTTNKRLSLSSRHRARPTGRRLEVEVATPGWESGVRWTRVAAGVSVDIRCRRGKISMADRAMNRTETDGLLTLRSVSAAGWSGRSVSGAQI